VKSEAKRHRLGGAVGDALFETQRRPAQREGLLDDEVPRKLDRATCQTRLRAKPCCFIEP
jgi:hypothetical protein